MANEALQTSADPQVEQFLQNLESKGIVISDREMAKSTVNNLLSQGFSLGLIESKLKEYNNDFTAVKKYFEDISSTKQKAEQAVHDVKEMKEEKVKEEKQKKLSSRISLIITSFAIGGVGFFTWLMMKRTTAGLGDVSLVGGPAGGLLDSFVKGSFIVGVAGVVVGIILAVFVAAQHFIKKSKEEEGKEMEKVALQSKQQAEASEGAKEMEAEMGNAEKSSKESLEAPKLS